MRKVMSCLALAGLAFTLLVYGTAAAGIVGRGQSFWVAVLPGVLLAAIAAILLYTIYKSHKMLDAASRSPEPTHERMAPAEAGPAPREERHPKTGTAWLAAGWAWVSLDIILIAANISHIIGEMRKHWVYLEYVGLTGRLQHDQFMWLMAMLVGIVACVPLIAGLVAFHKHHRNSGLTIMLAGCVLTGLAVLVVLVLSCLREDSSMPDPGPPT
jgi:hypothetical protein